MGEMQRDGGLASAALEVRNRGAECPATRARRHQRLAPRLEFAPQRIDLIQREPTLASIGLNLTCGQGWIGRHFAPESRLVEPEDQLGYFPRRKPAQGFLALGRESLLPNPALHL